MVSVVGDPESHGAGNFLEPGSRTVSISGKKVIIVGDAAAADLALHPTGATNAASGLGTVTIGS